MNQPVHILRKDARHLWPEIAVSIALLLALCWVTSHNHGAPDPDLPWLYPLLGALLKFLVPLTWLVLISRLVHDEPLVGDRQYWITRPYTWPALLGAKLLFLLLFVFLPLWLMQAFLLHRAGLHPLLLAWPFLRNSAGIAAAIVLPLLALAAVTSTFIRYALSVLAAVVYLIAVIALAAFTAANKIDVPGTAYVHWTLLVLLPLAALVIQYALRKTALARGLLIALPALLYLVVLLTPASAIIGHQYAGALPAKLAFDPGPQYQQQDSSAPFQFRGRMALQLPVLVSGLDPQTSLTSQHVSLRLQAPDGYLYESGWVEGVNNLAPLPLPVAEPLRLLLPAAVYDRVKGQAVALHVTLGAERFAPGAGYNVPATATPFPVPHGGACNFASAQTDDPGSAPAPGTLPQMMNCNFPFTNSDVLRVSTAGAVGDCPAAAVSAAPAAGAPRLNGDIPASLGVPALDPVNSEQVALSPGAGTLIDMPTPATLCPGTPVYFTEVRSTGKGSVTLDVPSIVLDSYAVRAGSAPGRRR